MEFAAQGELEARAWAAAEGEGAWRYHWSEEKDGEQHILRRRPEALLMSEALVRANPSDAEDRDALIALLTAIETGAITGAHRGVETLLERNEEEGR